MIPLLLLLTLLPSISALVNCRIACKTCRDNTEPPTTLEIYCALCQECKDRRRELLREREKSIENTVDNVKIAPKARYHPGFPGFMPPMMPMAPMYGPLPIVPAIPDGCPMPPPCESSEEVPAQQKLRLVVETTSTTTTTTTTTNRPSSKPRCPTNPPCRKKLRFAPPPMIPVYQHVINIPMMPCPLLGPCFPPALPIPSRENLVTAGVEATTTSTTSLSNLSEDSCELVAVDTDEVLDTADNSTQKDFTYMFVGIPKDL